MFTNGDIFSGFLGGDLLGYVENEQLSLAFSDFVVDSKLRCRLLWDNTAKVLDYIDVLILHARFRHHGHHMA
jgi:hypothetical protein